MSYITYTEYFADSNNLFQAYHLQQAQLAGMRIPSAMVAASKKALANGDEWLNTIPLSKWDQISATYSNSLSRANEKVNGRPSWSLSDGVCAAKALAMHLAATTPN